MYAPDIQLVYDLNRPTIDLGPYSSLGPVLNEGIELARVALVSDKDCTRVHGGLLSSSRERIALSAGQADYIVPRPSDIVDSSRNPSWRPMCECCEKFDKLDPRKKINLLWLLYRLAFHHFVIELSERWLGSSTSIHRPTILCMKGLSNYTLSLDGRAELDISPFAAAHSESEQGSWASIEASYSMSQINARTKGDVESLSHWLTRQKESIAAADVDRHETAKLLSRYFRISCHTSTAPGTDRRDGPRHGAIRVLARSNASNVSRAARRI